MKRFSLLSLCVMGGIALVLMFGFVAPNTFTFSNVPKLLSSIFFVDSTTTVALKESYRSGERIRVLIVPGHDNESWGTEFLGIREADMTLALGEELYAFLKADSHFDPVITREKNGYTDEFQNYFDKDTGRVRGFVANKKRVMQDLLKQGLAEKEEGVVHNTAVSSVAYRLYSINTWANENDIDLVIHIHINDYPGRRWNQTGRYDGFTVYVPDGQYSNAKPSRVIGEAIASTLSTVLATSNLPTEAGQGGVVPDQELIALGSYNTLDPASVLIEYGYIYEPQFRTTASREVIVHEFAFQTYLGLNQFFGNFLETFRTYKTSLLPYQFKHTLTQGSPAGRDILSLQEALSLQGVYPPDGEDLHSCPKSGHFGPCTRRGVREFQELFGLPSTGYVDAGTQAKLSELYSR